MELNELVEKGKKVFEAKEKIKELKKEIRIIEESISQYQQEILEEIEESELENLDIAGVGKLYVKSTVSYSLPKGEDKKKFLDFLKQKGVYETMVTVNSQTLNRFCKEMFENDPMLEIPGIREPFIKETLASRKSFLAFWFIRHCSITR